MNRRRLMQSNGIPEGALSGVFSVSSNKQVYFSQGNLQYNKSTSTWSFIENQYSTVETNNQRVGTDYAKQNIVGLFGWGTSGKTISNYGSAYQPYATSGISMNYGPTGKYSLTGDYADGDWGVNMGPGWRTLTMDEWSYLFNTRTASTVNGTANARYVKAYLFGTTHGVIIFPDSYTHPAGVTAPVGINDESSTGWNGNQYIATDWAKMEAAGCVFLPTTGSRTVASVYNVSSSGYYWSSTLYSTTDTVKYARRFNFENSNMYFTSGSYAD